MNTSGANQLDQGTHYDPTIVDVVGLAKAMEAHPPTAARAEDIGIARVRMGEAQAKAVADALRSLASAFDGAARRGMPPPCQPYVDFALGEQGFRAAVAALRATLEPAPAETAS